MRRSELSIGSWPEIRGPRRQRPYTFTSVDLDHGAARSQGQIDRPGVQAGQPCSPTLIGVCGGSGSGKTTLAHRLVDHLGRDQAQALSFDAYYRDFAGIPAAERSQLNFDHPDSLDDGLLVDHLKRLRQGSEIPVPVYDFAHHTRSADIELVEPTPYVIVEGILLFAFAEVRQQMDHLIFRHVEADVRAKRRLTRDVVERGRTAESVKQQWRKTVQPMHERFVEPFAAHADVITTPDQPLDQIVDQLGHAITNGLPLSNVAASSKASTIHSNR